MEEKNCGFLTREEIKDVLRDSKILGDEYKPDDDVEGIACRLRLGDEVYVSGDDYPKSLSDNDPFISLPRGQFALLLTKESLSMPDNIFGLISIRMGKKEQGLINISGFHVDPGFEGKLIFSVFNAGPADVVLKRGDDMFIMFLYQLHNKVSKDKTSEAHRGQQHLPIKIVTSLKGTSASLADVDKRVGRLEIRERIFWAILIAVITALAAIFIRGFS